MPEQKQESKLVKNSRGYFERKYFYKFRCVKCGKERRTTRYLKKARVGICRTCLKNQVPQNQLSLLDN